MAKGHTLPGVDAALQCTLATLQLHARRAVDGAHRGGHEARGRGQSHSFVEQRAYVVGDEPRHIDWRAFARRGRPQVKLFAKEARSTLEVVLDASASMGYLHPANGPDHTALSPLSKWDSARVLGYALCSVALRQADAAGLSAWHDKARRLIPARQSRGHQSRLLLSLCGMAPAGTGEAHDLLTLFAGRPRVRRIVVIGDFLRPGLREAQALGALARRGHSVCALHLVHPDELDLPPTEVATLVDLEDQAQVQLGGEAQLAAFAARIRKHHRALQVALMQDGVAYLRHLVGTPLSETLRAYARVSGR